MARVFIYVRVSDDTRKKGGGSKGQEESCRAFCEANDLTVQGVYRELDVSGSLMPSERPQMSKILSQAKRGDIILADTMDRFARSVRAQIILEHMCSEMGVDVWVASNERMNEESTDDDIMRLFESWAAQKYRKDLIRKVKRGHKRLREDSKKYCREAPFGFMFIDGEMKPNPVEFQTIQTAVEIIDNGMSYAEAARYLHQHGHTNRNGKPIDRFTVRRIIQKREQLNYGQYFIQDYQTPSHRSGV